jgi:hypothetical protein
MYRTILQLAYQVSSSAQNANQPGIPQDSQNLVKVLNLRKVKFVPLAQHPRRG